MTRTDATPRAALVAVALAALVLALALAAGASPSALLGGLRHPLLGLDHVVAMVAVGIWGGMLGPRASWVLPLVFPAVMAVGGAMGVAGVPVPAVETGIALSGLILGLMVAMAVRAPVWAAALVVGPSRCSTATPTGPSSPRA